MIRFFFKIFVGIMSVMSVLYLIIWLFSLQSFEVDYGVSFNQQHAVSLGLDWKEVYDATITELRPEYIRIAAMWSEVEAVQGVYDFADVDYMMDLAESHDVQVLLVVGQKAPRWPECHVPSWIDGYTAADVEGHLFEYVEAVVAQYKDHPALERWQVENEAFIPFQFGECEGFRRDLVKQEIDLVRSLDPEREIVLTDSGELSTWYQPSRLADVFGTTLYRIVETPKGKVFTYDWLPPGFYKLKARLLGLSYDEFIVAELQAEPWFTDSNPTSVEPELQQEKFPLERMQNHIAYTRHVGANRTYLWGVEWWYYMKEVHGVDAYWNVFLSVAASSTADL
jgi:hypothetical protein